MKYKIAIKEIHYSIRIVEADSLEEALGEAGGAEEEELIYSHTADTSEWTWEEIDES
jgi:hypothetical protein